MSLDDIALAVLVGLGATLAAVLTARPTRTYYRLLFGRACADARHPTRAEYGGTAVGVLAVMGSWVLGGEVDIPRLLGGSTFGLAAYFIVLFMLNLIMAPVRIHREQEDKVAALSAQVHRQPRVVLRSDPYRSDETYEQRIQWPTSWGVLGGRTDEVRRVAVSRIYSVDQVEEGVMLVCKAWGSPEQRETARIPDHIECWLEDPQGKRHKGVPEHDGRRAVWLYPKDFNIEPQTGRHYAEWKAPLSELYSTETNNEMVVIHHRDFLIGVEVK